MGMVNPDVALPSPPRRENRKPNFALIFLVIVVWGIVMNHAVVALSRWLNPFAIDATMREFPPDVQSPSLPALVFGPWAPYMLIYVAFGLVAGFVLVLSVIFLLPRFHCTECGELRPRFRRPSLRQSFVGGWDCPHCHASFDRRGRPRGS